MYPRLFWNSHCVVKDKLVILITLLYLPSAGITSMYEYAPFMWCWELAEISAYYAGT